MAGKRNRLSKALSVGIFVISTSAVAYIWLYLFRDRWLTLTYGLPLLLCLWQRDKALLWSMTGALLFMTFLKGFVIMPGTGVFHYAQFVMQGVNLLVIAVAIHLVLTLTSRLQSKNEQLAESNRNLEAVARFPEENPNPVMRIAPDGAVMYTNPSARQLLDEAGWREGDPAPLELHNIARQALAKSDSVDMDFQCCENRVVAFTAAPVKPGGYVNLYGKDITRERETEAALRHSEQLFRSTFENAAVGVSHIDAEGRLLRANSYLQRLLDYSMEDLRSSGFLALTWPSDREDERELYSRLVAGEIDSYSLEKRYMRKDGAPSWVLVTRSAQRDQNGKFMYSINIIQDIAKRKAAEEKLRRYELLSQNTRDIVLFMRMDDGRIIEANAAAEKAYGYEGDEWLGLTIFDLRADSTLNETPEQMQAAFEQGILFETEHRRKDGRAFPVEVSSRGAVVGGMRTLISIIRDITERKRAEDALRRGEEEALARAAELRDLADDLERSNQDLEQFAYVVSHDLQEPLRQIVGFAELLSKRYSNALDDTALEFLDFIVEGGSRMQNLIRDLLAFSRVGREEMARKPTPMADIVESALFNLRLSLQEAGATVTQDPLPELNVNRGQFIQVFQNLIGNSLKFRGPDPPKIHIGCREEEGRWVFCVKDNGIGFEQELAKTIFQPFRRLHRGDYEGSGIGLAICRRVVEIHGGRIWVESKPGEGSTFYFTLPAE